jgi:signal transduction histidine kinase
MVAVKGYTKLLLKGSAGGLAPPQREYLQISLKNIDRQLTLIDGLLDYSRLERLADPLQPDWTDMGEIVKECLQSIEPEVQRKALRVEHHADRDGYPLWGDRLRLTQALSNLVANAVKFTPSGGFIRIELEQPEPNAVVVRITDNGIGIPEEIQDKIFDRFFQADSSAARRFGGVGLGLAITREIVAHHGGQISVRSQSGRGASFTLVLPARPRERGDGSVSALTAAEGRQDPVSS